MPVELVRLSAFLGVGGTLWWLSLRAPMAEYGPQPVARIDRWFFVVSLLLAGAYALWVAPVLAGWMQQAGPFVESLRTWAGSAHPALQVAAFLVATDFLSYWAHRFMHTRWGWNLHAFHHSAQSLNWFSGMRGSPLHYVLVLSPGTLMASIFLVSHSPWLVFALSIFDALTQNLMHTNLRVPFARKLEWVIITPRMHFVHHHRDPHYGGFNFGFNFAIWDHLFGTYIDADSVPQKGNLGLDEHLSTGRLFVGIDAHPSGPEARNAHR